MSLVAVVYYLNESDRRKENPKGVGRRQIFRLAWLRKLRHEEHEEKTYGMSMGVANPSVTTAAGHSGSFSEEEK